MAMGCQCDGLVRPMGWHCDGKGMAVGCQWGGVVVSMGVSLVLHWHANVQPMGWHCDGKGLAVGCQWCGVVRGNGGVIGAPLACQWEVNDMAL